MLLNDKQIQFVEIWYKEFVDIKKADMKSLTYDQLLLFLKNIDAKKNGGRLDPLKTFLKDREIVVEAVKSYGKALIDADVDKSFLKEGDVLIKRYEFL